VRTHSQRLRQLTAAEHLHQPVLVHQPPRSQRVRVDRARRVERLERVEVDDAVLDAERVLEPLRLRRAPHEGGLTTLEPRLHGVARALSLHAAARGLASLARDAAADTTARPARTLRRL